MLYDKEWTELFISLESEVEDERERIIKLCECVKVGKNCSILSKYLVLPYKYIISCRIKVRDPDLHFNQTDIFFSV